MLCAPGAWVRHMQMHLCAVSAGVSGPDDTAEPSAVATGTAWTSSFNGMN